MPEAAILGYCTNLYIQVNPSVTVAVLPTLPSSRRGRFDNTAIVQSRDTAGLFVQGPPIVPTAPGTPPVTLSTITQSGDHNYAAIGQTSVSRTEQSVSGVTQINSGNKAYVNQADAGQSSTVLQTSGSNMAFVNQGLGGPGTNATTDNISLVNQIGEGGGSTATVEQDGTLDNSAVTQSGTADVAVVKQKDPNYSPGTSGVNDTANFSTVSQSGSSDRADVGQAGLHNTSTITELNTNNDANVSQAGTYNVSTVSQNAATGTAGYTGQLYGAIIYPYPQTNHNSMVIVRQVGDNLTSKTTENGAATFAFVNQVGMGETSTVTQTVAGSNNAAFVEQFGTGNTSSFVQTGSNNQSQPLPNTDVSGKLVGAKGIHQFGNANYCGDGPLNDLT